jgi:hypothetical protein
VAERVSERELELDRAQSSVAQQAALFYFCVDLMGKGESVAESGDDMHRSQE